MYQRDYTTGGLTFKFVIKACTSNVENLPEGLYEGDTPEFSVTILLDEKEVATYFKNSIPDAHTAAVAEARKIVNREGFTEEEITQLEGLKYKII